MMLKPILKCNNLLFINIAFYSFKCISQYKETGQNKSALQAEDAL
jgi:hypothetical protein